MPQPPEDVHDPVWKGLPLEQSKEVHWKASAKDGEPRLCRGRGMPRPSRLLTGGLLGDQKAVSMTADAEVKATGTPADGACALRSR